ncbi:hypothetical protein Pelo_1641 [Pelomyxa schiedti]|nr:hypothetical protein Pelo_1641 [Pelomyxa schiedti]
MPTDRCCLCFTPRVAPYALVVELLLRCGGVSSLRRDVLPSSHNTSPVGGDADVGGGVGPFDFAVAVVAEDDRHTYEHAKRVVGLDAPENIKKPVFDSGTRGHEPVRQKFVIVYLLENCSWRLPNFDWIVIVHGSIVNDLTDVVAHHYYLPLVPLHRRECSAEWGVFGKHMDRDDSVAGWHICFLLVALHRIPGLRIENVHYLTDLRHCQCIGYLNTIDKYLSEFGSPLPRLSVDFDELDLAWIQTLHKEELLVRDPYSPYEKVRDAFVDVTEAFYVSLALSLHPQMKAQVSRALSSQMGDTKLPATSLPTSAVETQQTIAEMTSECTSLFQIEAANVEQVCAWLRPLGVTENSLSIITTKQLQGSMLVNFSVQQLCDLGLTVGDAAHISEHVLANLMLEPHQEQEGQSDAREKGSHL